MGKVNNTSILSGILVGIGVIINVLSPNKYIGSMLFSLALLTTIDLQLQLFTGQIGFAIDKKFTFVEYIFMLFGNLLGISVVVVSLFPFIGTNASYEQMIKIATNKFSHTHIQLLICGIMCGILMMIAVYCKNMIITIFCIMTFILSGYEHCIASFPFLVFAPSIVNLTKFLTIVVGNSIGSIITNMFIKGGK